MPELEIYHAKFGHSGIKNKEVMTDFVLKNLGGIGLRRENYQVGAKGWGVIRINHF